MLQQKERDNARLFFKQWNYPFLFALTRKYKQPTARVRFKIKKHSTFEINSNPVKRKKITLTILYFIFSFGVLHAQNIYFQFSNSTYGQYSLSDIRSITFSGTDMNLNLISGGVVTVPMNSVSSFNYTGYTTDITNLTDKDEISVYPNPTNGTFTINCSLTLPDKVIIELLTINGELLNSSNQQAVAGNNSFLLNTTDKPPLGNYICRISTSQSVITKKIIIIK